MEYPTIAVHLRRGVTPELASLIQDALRRRNELAPYARREIYRDLAAYLQSEVSQFPDELIERLSDEQYLINASGVLFGSDARLPASARTSTQSAYPHASLASAASPPDASAE
jgi:hypothetical protein